MLLYLLVHCNRMKGDVGFVTTGKERQPTHSSKNLACLFSVSIKDFFFYSMNHFQLHIDSHSVIHGIDVKCYIFVYNFIVFLLISLVRDKSMTKNTTLDCQSITNLRIESNVQFDIRDFIKACILLHKAERCMLKIILGF